MTQYLSGIGIESLCEGVTASSSDVRLVDAREFFSRLAEPVEADVSFIWLQYSPWHLAHLSPDGFDSLLDRWMQASRDLLSQTSPVRVKVIDPLSPERGTLSSVRALGIEAASKKLSPRQKTELVYLEVSVRITHPDATAIWDSIGERFSLSVNSSLPTRLISQLSYPKAVTTAGHSEEIFSEKLTKLMTKLHEDQEVIEAQILNQMNELEELRESLRLSREKEGVSAGALNQLEQSLAHARANEVAREQKIKELEQRLVAANILLEDAHDLSFQARVKVSELEQLNQELTLKLRDCETASSEETGVRDVKVSEDHDSQAHENLISEVEELKARLATEEKLRADILDRLHTSEELHETNSLGMAQLGLLLAEVKPCLTLARRTLAASLRASD